MRHGLMFLVTIGFMAAACASNLPSPSPSGMPPGTTAPTTTAPSTTAPTQAADFDIESAQFVNTGGCGDVFFWATNAAGDAAITIQWGGAASEAWANDGFNATEQLPNPEITVSVVEGNQLTGYYCNDVLGPGQGPASTIEATTGTIDVSVTPNREGFQPAGQADLRLSDVTFEVGFGGGQTWHLDELVIENVSVGWFAG